MSTWNDLPSELCNHILSYKRPYHLDKEYIRHIENRCRKRAVHMRGICKVIKWASWCLFHCDVCKRVFKTLARHPWRFCRHCQTYDQATNWRGHIGCRSWAENVYPDAFA